MKNRLALALFLFIAASLPVFAQNTPQFEVFGGATWIRADISPDLSAFGVSHVNGFGWHASATENVNGWIGGTFDFSGAYSRPTLKNPLTGATFSNGVNTSAYTFMCGPNFSYHRHHMIVPFARVLLGGANARANTTSKGTAALGSPLKFSDTRFALAAGGGADIVLTPRIALRGTAEWIRSTFDDFGDDRQNNLRVSAGIVFRFGENK